MVDTIVLAYQFNLADAKNLIDQNSYDEWNPSLTGILSPPYIKMGHKGSIKSVRNLSDKIAGIYAPKLTVFKQVVNGGFKCILYIEFSAPKLLFGNNFSEVNDTDLDVVCSRLSALLESNNIHISERVLKTCTVKTIHYSKNIVLDDGAIPSQILRYLSKAKMPASGREQNTNFVNGGEALYESSGSTKVFCAYDKKRELQNVKRSEKGNFETENWCQLDLLSKLDNKEVLRLGLRLVGKRAIRTELDKIGADYSRQDLPLCDLFSSNISKQLLSGHINHMESLTPRILAQESSPDDFLEQLTMLNPRARLGLKLKVSAIKLLSQSGMSTRQIRQCLNASNQQWSYLTKKMDELNMPNANFDMLGEVKRQLDEFQSVRLECDQ